MSVKLSLQVSDQLNQRLEDISKGMGGSKSEVLRRAIALIEVMDAAQRKNQKLAVLEKDSNKMVSEIVMI